MTEVRQQTTPETGAGVLRDVLRFGRNWLARGTCAAIPRPRKRLTASHSATSSGTLSFSGEVHATLTHEKALEEVDS